MASTDPRFKIEITYLREVNWSLLRIGVPVVSRLHVRSLGALSEDDLARITVRFSIAGFVDSGRLPLSVFSGDANAELLEQLQEQVTVDFEEAMCLANPRRTVLHLEVGPYVATCPIRLLTPDEWCAGVSWDEERLRFALDSTLEWADTTFEVPPGGSKTVESVQRPWKGPVPLQAGAAVLVQPDHPLCAAVRDHALTLLVGIIGSTHPSLVDLAAGTVEERRGVVKAMFTALADRHRNVVHVLERFSLEPRSQRIRFPAETLGQDHGRRHGATCVDFALLFCGVLAGCSLDPLFILVGTAPRQAHALVGCWLADERDSGILLTDRESLWQEVRDRRLLVVDVTEFARGTGFDRACELGASLLMPSDAGGGGQLCYALDLRAVYDLGVKPLPLVHCPSTRFVTRRGWLAVVALAAFAGLGATVWHVVQWWLHQAKPLVLQAAVFYEDTNSHPRKLSPGAVLRSGRGYRVYVEPQQACYVYVIQADSLGHVDVLHPNPEYGTHDAYVPADRAIWVPAPERWLELDQTVGLETLYVICSRAAREDIETLLARATRHDASATTRQLAQDLAALVRTMGVAAVRREKPLRDLGTGGLTAGLMADELVGSDVVVAHRFSFRHE